MRTVRFSKIVETAGKPSVHVLWMDPSKDAILQKAIHADRVMTVYQRTGDAKADYGTVGLQKSVSGQILVFPKSLKPFAGKRIIGVKYDLLDWPAVPKNQQAPKATPAKRPTKNKPRDTKVHAVTAEGSGAEEGSTTTIVKFPNSVADDEDPPNADVEEIKNQVRHAMKLLEDGKQVAAFNLLKSIVDR